MDTSLKRQNFLDPAGWYYTYDGLANRLIDSTVQSYFSPQVTPGGRFDAVQAGIEDVHTGRSSCLEDCTASTPQLKSLVSRMREKPLNIGLVLSAIEIVLRSHGRHR